MRAIAVGLWSMIMFTGCLSVRTTHEIVPIGVGNETAADAAKKTRKDLADLCSDKSSAFWRLPVKEQDHVAKQVFSNMQNIDHIQHIGLTSLKGEPLEITMLLYDKYNACHLRFVRDRKGEWTFLVRSILNVD